MNDPPIIHCGKLIIAGASGDGNDTGAVWDVFERKSEVAPLRGKRSDNGYEIRVYQDNACGIHVGCAVADAQPQPPHTLFELPASHYAVFEVRVANGYDSENKAMEAWLQSNPMGYWQKLLDGASYVIEYYDERFRGNEPDSIVEIWIPIEKKKRSLP